MTDCTNTLATQTNTFLHLLGSSPLYVTDPATTQAVKPQNNPATGTHVFNIVGRDRIFYVNVFARDGGTRYEAVLSGVRAADSMPCYWLPWTKDGAVKIKLKPSEKANLGALGPRRQTTVTANDSSAILLGGDRNNWADRNVPQNADPVLFFTGMMNGCSVWVSGEARAPQVYHINRAGYEGDAVARLLDQGKEKKVNEVKSERMEKDFLAIHTADRKWYQGTPTHGKVTPTTQQMRNPMPFGAAANARQDRSKLLSKVTGVQSTNYYIQKHFTTAFGVRVNGTWNFYKQDVYEYFLYRMDGQIDRSVAARVAATRAQLFFPS